MKVIIKTEGGYQIGGPYPVWRVYHNCFHIEGIKHLMCWEKLDYKYMEPKNGQKMGIEFVIDAKTIITFINGKKEMVKEHVSDFLRKNKVSIPDWVKLDFKKQVTSRIEVIDGTEF